MPKLGYRSYYYWSRKESAQHDTERHEVFRKELYVAASLSRQEFLDKLEVFKEKNFDLLNNKLEG